MFDFEKFLIIVALAMFASMPLFFDHDSDHASVSASHFTKNIRMIKMRLKKLDRQLRHESLQVAANLKKPFSATDAFAHKYAILPVHLQNESAFVKQVVYEWISIRRDLGWQ